MNSTLSLTALPLAPQEIKHRSILVVEDDGEYVQLLRSVLASRPELDLTVAGSLEEAERYLSRFHYELILMDMSLPDSVGLATFHALSARAHDTPILILTGLDDDSVAMEAVKQGAQDFLVKQQMHWKALLRAITHTLERAPVRRGTAQIIGFVGSKGGVGTSTLVINTAAVLSQSEDTAIVELRSWHGSLCAFAPRSAPVHLGSLCSADSHIVNARELVDNLITISPGLRLLCAPETHDAADELPGELIRSAISSLGGITQRLLLDLPALPSATTRAALPQCHEMIVVVDREPSSIHAGRRTIEYLRASGVPTASIEVVLVNRTALDLPISMDEVRAGLGWEIAAVIPPAAQLCVAAQRRAVPFALWQQESLATTAIREFAQRLARRNAETAVIQ